MDSPELPAPSPNWPWLAGALRFARSELGRSSMRLTVSTLGLNQSCRSPLAQPASLPSPTIRPAWDGMPRQFSHLGGSRCNRDWRCDSYIRDLLLRNPNKGIEHDY